MAATIGSSACLLLPKPCLLRRASTEAVRGALVHGFSGGGRETLAEAADIHEDQGGGGSGGGGSAASGGMVSLVQGASKGLGLEFVRQLLERDPKNKVIATCRSPSKAVGLATLKHQHTQRLSILPLDVTNEPAIEAAAKFVANQLGRLDLLINSAGILHSPGILQPETSLSKVDSKALLLTYQVNAVGPTLVIKHMWPLLTAGKGVGSQKAVVANLSARIGSIGDNRTGGWHSYRASKTALNQLTKNISLEFARRKDPIICILLHPGTVDTDLSKPFQRNVPNEKLFTTQYSVRRLLEIIDKIEMQDNGKFFAWDGQEIEW
ncbi:hypothetical protein O6H91_01G114600 [Diphasiastrum complanatum]|uniref:Uncharacterized protein n=1 Tax=Diphasiastrum complanatum TaxID=34168 RepID=A0ACC2EUW2_DIPCM|nr:hypothetical protein O6H91_01G114600 [Diphasiastrum complanatum]